MTITVLDPAAVSATPRWPSWLPSSRDGLMMQMPAPLPALATEYQQARTAFDEAVKRHRAATAKDVIDAAKRKDADARAVKMRAGEKDPGPAHLTRALKAADDARQVCDGHLAVAKKVWQDIREQLRALDWEALDAQWRARAATHRDDLHQALATVARHSHDLAQARRAMDWCSKVKRYIDPPAQSPITYRWPALSALQTSVHTDGQNEPIDRLLAFLAQWADDDLEPEPDEAA